MVKNIQGQEFEEFESYHISDFNTLDFEYDQEYKEPIERPKLCIFCNSEWTPKMEKIYLSSGYCESCYETETCHVVVCSNCNRIVYKK